MASGMEVQMSRAAVAGEVHGEGVEAGRHELDVAHGAGPGADHVLRRRVAGLQDAQCGDQLAAEEVGAATGGGQRRHCLDDVVLPRAVP